MKRFLLALLAVVGLLLIAAPAHADKPQCYVVETLPNECLSAEAVALIEKLTAERDYWQRESAYWNEGFNNAHQEIYLLATHAGHLNERLDRKNERIACLRARMKMLQARV